MPTDPTHGRVRALPDPDRIGITLDGTEHALSREEAMGLATAIVLTWVDRRERGMDWMRHEEGTTDAH